ncbi:DNA-binding domain-containing protein [Myxococcota bacterium]|nr:DNA-binding domain-containing protein [Myxococcota bacterium]
MDEAREGFAEYILRADPPTTPPFANADLYRRFVRKTISRAIRQACPKAAELLGDDAFVALMTRFFAAGGPKTPYFRDLPGDFVDWVVETDEPLSDLFQWEWLHRVAERDPADLDVFFAPGAGPGLQDRVVVVNPTIQVGLYGREVDRLSPETRVVDTFTEARAFLVWRVPETDDVETDVAGLLLFRALAIASEAPAPIPIDALHAALVREAPTIDPAELQSRVDAFLASLAARLGVRP